MREWYNQIEDMAISPEIFRAYDVRGTYPDEINAEVARAVANATARYLRARILVVGEDGRPSSPELRIAVIESVMQSGCDVQYIGRCTTPLFYYAVSELGADGGIMITASHNPLEQNGLKIVGRDAIPIGLENGLEIIMEFAQQPAESKDYTGRVIENFDITDKYIQFLINESGIKLGSISFPIVIDAGNGVAGITIEPLFQKLRVQFIPLRFRIDGSSSECSLDPSKPGALSDLAHVVKREQAAVGFAFDGDADRIAVVDECGKLVPAQYILALLWRDTSSWWHKPKVVYDLRFSRAVREIFGKHGVRSMVGHTNISNMMRYERADIGGETSGHFYFKVMSSMESSELAVLKLIRFLYLSGKPLSELVAPLIKYSYSGEITMPFGGVAQISDLIRALKSKYRDGKQDEMDGLTVEYPGWWFNIRPSQTEPVVRLVVEAIDTELMEEKIREIRALAGYVGC